MSSTSSAEMATADDVLQYWYQDNADSVQDEHSKAIGALWFGKSDATDHYIRTTYGSLVEAAMRGGRYLCTRTCDLNCNIEEL